jgi:hypothetical protein
MSDMVFAEFTTFAFENKSFNPVQPAAEGEDAP